MSKLNEQDAPVEKEYTPEELKQMRERMMKSYKESIEVLKLQDEFERLTANIAESQAKTMMNQIRMAQMAMGPPKETPASDPENPSKRKLKNDE
jgi:CHASE3 domain sensor protein